MKKILVIIVTYNGSKWIENCIDSVINSSLASDVFIVDNCSSDDTVSIIEGKYAQAVIFRIYGKDLIVWSLYHHICSSYGKTSSG
jgi:glycosyltransferase involved in cell wall biosynthesis